MATMNISLPNSMHNWVKSQSKEGLYANNSDYVRDLIRKDQQRIEKLKALQGAIQQDFDSGKPKAFDKENFKKRMRAKR